jgi:hypothetical protein
MWFCRRNTTGLVTKWDEVNRYGYSAIGLFVPYALANLFAGIVVLLGLVSYFRHGVLPEKKFQDIASAARDPGVGLVMQRDTRKQSVTGLHVDGTVVLRLGQQ